MVMPYEPVSGSLRLLDMLAELVIAQVVTVHMENL